MSTLANEQAGHIWVIHAHAIGVPIPFFVVHLVLNSFGWHPSAIPLMGMWCEPPWVHACATMEPPGRFSVIVLSQIVYAGLVVCRFFIGFLTNAIAVFLSIGKFRYVIVRKQ